MANHIDLHMHTNKSDGIVTPSTLLEIVRRENVAAFSVTDHDTLGGYFQIIEMLKPNDPELITGVELSCSIGDDDVHMLGYFFDPEDDALIDALAEFQDRRSRRGEKMVDRLNELGIDLTYDDVESVAAGAVIGRPHIAQALVDHGAVDSFDAAFNKYVATGKPAYVPKQNFTPAEAISLIHNAGGLAILAHPGIGNVGRHIEDLVRLGLDGVEIYHPAHSDSDTSRYRYEASRFNLLVSGGSDFHGRGDRHSMVGSQKVPLEVLEKMKRKAQQRRENS